MNQEDNIDARRLYDPKATRTVYFGNLDARIDTELLYEIAIQAGPVKRISIPPSQGYGFVVRQEKTTRRWFLVVHELLRREGAVLIDRIVYTGI